MNAIKVIFLLGIVVLFATCRHQDDPTHETEHAQNIDQVHNHEGDDQISYDAKLAEKLGADEYGMSQYVIAFLKSGPNRSQDSITAAQMQRAHLDNITRLAEEGKMVLAGPFLDDMDLRGIYIFNVATVEEAEELTAMDPMIKEGRLIMELHPWYGSAALKQVNNLHPAIAKKKI